MSKYVAEARIFGAGRIVSKVRLAQEGEENNHRETQTCEIWVDVFDTEQEAREFCRGYKS